MGHMFLVFLKPRQKHCVFSVFGTSGTIDLWIVFFVFLKSDQKHYVFCVFRDPNLCFSHLGNALGLGDAGVSPARPRELAGAVGEGATPCTDGRPSEKHASVDRVTPILATQRGQMIFTSRTSRRAFKITKTKENTRVLPPHLIAGFTQGILSFSGRVPIRCWSRVDAA